MSCGRTWNSNNFIRGFLSAGQPMASLFSFNGTDAKKLGSNFHESMVLADCPDSPSKDDRIYTTVGASCASAFVRSTRLAGFCCTDDESSICAIRPPARPRLNAPGGGLRKPSAPRFKVKTNVATMHHETRFAVHPIF